MAGTGYSYPESPGYHDASVPLTSDADAQSKHRLPWHGAAPPPPFSCCSVLQKAVKNSVVLSGTETFKGGLLHGEAARVQVDLSLV